MSWGYCVSDIFTKCGAGLAIYQISKANSETMPWRKNTCVRADVSCGFCVSDIITKCDAGLAIYQISKAKSETMQ